MGEHVMYIWSDNILHTKVVIRTNVLPNLLRFDEQFKLALAQHVERLVYFNYFSSIEYAASHHEVEL